MMSSTTDISSLQYGYSLMSGGQSCFMLGHPSMMILLRLRVSFMFVLGIMSSTFCHEQCTWQRSCPCKCSYCHLPCCLSQGILLLSFLLHTVLTHEIWAAVSILFCHYIHRECLNVTPVCSTVWTLYFFGVIFTALCITVNLLYLLDVFAYAGRLLGCCCMPHQPYVSPCLCLLVLFHFSPQGWRSVGGCNPSIFTLLGPLPRTVG